MMPVVAENIAHGVCHLAPRAERVRMIAVREDGSAPIRAPVEALCEANGQALHAPSESEGAFRFDKQMQVIALDGVVDDAHTEALRSLLKRRRDLFRAAL